MEGIMAEYTVRVWRKEGESRLELVIHDDQVVSQGKLHPIGVYGHPDYAELYQHTLDIVNGS